MHKRISILILILILAISAFAGAQEEGKRLRILISNDDGYTTPGIRALAVAFAKLGDVTVIAPQGNQSGTSQSIVYRTPIFFARAESIGEASVWWVDATPASTVRFAIEYLMKDGLPDLVVSGINRGANIGDAVYYSGTIGAAREGAMRGIPSIAVSMESRSTGYDAAAEAAVRIAKMYLSMDNRPEMLNVNLPGGEITEATPLLVTTKRAHEPKSKIDVRDNPQRSNMQYFWTTFQGYSKAEEGSDLHALSQGAISIMPIRVDPVDYDVVEDLRKALAQ